MAGDACRDCGATDASSFLGELGPLCDRCFDVRLSGETGFPELPPPPPPITLIGADGRRHTFRYRIWRAPTGIEAELEETGVPVGEGFHRAVLGAHDADVATLVSGVRELVEADLCRLDLEPNPNRVGWRMAGEVLEGRLVHDEDARDAGTPYRVVIDGRTLSWEELGHALEGSEGWRIRIAVSDRVDDLRPDAEIVAIGASVRRGTEPVKTALPTIDELLAAFLADQSQRLAERTYANYDSVVDLLRHCLNGYGHQYLDEAAQERFHSAFEEDEEAFVHLFGARELVAAIPEFLGYFMISKVMAGADLLRSAGTVTKRLAKWLGDHGYIDTAAVSDVSERGAEAARDLPRAERLSEVLYRLAEKSQVDRDGVPDEDYVDDSLTIDRVEVGALWFEGDLGPLRVPKAASDLARPGWSVNVVLARTEGTWHLLEVGNVYP